MGKSDTLTINQAIVKKLRYSWFWGLYLDNSEKEVEIYENVISIYSEPRVFELIRDKQNKIDHYPAVTRFFYWLFNISDYAYFGYVLGICKVLESPKIKIKRPLVLEDAEHSVWDGIDYTLKWSIRRLSVLCKGVVQDPVPEIPDRISNLPAELCQSGVSAFLTVEDKAALSATSTHFNRLFRPAWQKEKLKKLLQHVVHGEQKKAKAMLCTSPELLSMKGDVTDYSGRTFRNVSPWECMIWAQDTRYMGKMMLGCIPEGEQGNAIRQICLAQIEALQDGGRDLVKIDRNPSTMPLGDLKDLLKGLRADNKDVLIYHWDEASGRGRLYYYTNDTVTLLEYEPMNANEAFSTILRLMDMNSAKKSNDAEHALITRATGKALSRKGVHYEQPATYKSLVKLGGDVNPGDIAFAEIAQLFDTPDALLFWNNQFYYANKIDSTVTLIEPMLTLSNQQITAFYALKTSLIGMDANHSRLPNTLEEYELINTLFREHPAFKPTHHCETHYDFGIIDALQTYIDRFEGLDDTQRSVLWINKVAKVQRLSPVHVLQHYYDTNFSFFSLARFRGDQFIRANEVKAEDRFYSFIYSAYPNLFSKYSLDADFGFQFGLMLPMFGAPKRSVRPLSEMCMDDLSALCELCEVRAEDARELQQQLTQSLLSAPVIPARPEGPS